MRWPNAILAAVLIAQGTVLAQEQGQLASAAALAPELGDAPESLAHLSSIETVLERVGVSTPLLEDAQATLALIETWHSESERVSLSVLVGLITDGERDIARYASTNVLLLADAAERFIPRIIERADRTPGSNQEIVADLLHQLRVVVPLRAARALVLLGSIEEDGLRSRQLAEGAIALVEPVDQISPWSRAERARLSAQSLLLAGQPREALEAFERTSIQAGDKLPAPYRDRDTIENGIGIVLATLEAGDPVSARRALANMIDSASLIERHWSDPDLMLLRADVLMRIALTEANATDNKNDRYRTLSRGLLAYEQLRVQTDGRDDGPRIREMIYTRLGGVVEESWDFERLPVMALAARVSGFVSGNNPDDQSVEILESRIESEAQMNEVILRDVRWTLALRDHHLYKQGRWRVNGHRMFSFALSYPTDDRSARAIAIACPMAEAAWWRQKQHRMGLTPRSLDTILPIFRLADSIRATIPGRDRYRLAMVRIITSGLWVAALNGDAEQLLREADQVLSRIDDPKLKRARIGAQINLWSTVVFDLDSTYLDKNPGLSIEAAKAKLDLALDAYGLLDPIDIASLMDPLSGEELRRRVLSMARICRAADRTEQALTVIEPVASIKTGDPVLQRSLVSAQQLEFELLLQLDRPHKALSFLQTLAGQSDSGPGADPHNFRWATDSTWKRIAPIASRFIDRPLMSAQDAQLILFKTADSLVPDIVIQNNDAYLVRYRLAWATLLSGDQSETIKQFTPLQKKSSSSNNRQAILRGLGEAHLLLNDDVTAFATFKQLADQAPAHSRDYFHAWVRMLEILERQNDDGSRTSRILRELQRLQALPDVAKYQDCAARLRAIEARVNQ